VVLVVVDVRVDVRVAVVVDSRVVVVMEGVVTVVVEIEVAVTVLVTVIVLRKGGKGRPSPWGSSSGGAARITAKMPRKKSKT
jgi:hypothetical protein